MTRTPLSPEERRDILLRFGDDIILLFDDRFQLVDCNERAVEVYGYSRDELLSMGLGDIRVPQAHHDPDGRMVELRTSGRAVFEGLNRRRDGSTFSAETSLRMVETADGHYFHATVRDTTERRPADAEQTRREEELRTALRDALHRMQQAERTAHIGHWRHDVRTGVLEPSEELLRIVGAPPGAGPEDAEAFVHPEDREERRRVFQEVLAGKPYTHHGWRAVRPDGTVRYLSGAAEPVFDDAGSVAAVIGVTQDVTERTEALLAAQESADQYRALLENMLEGFAYCRMVYDEKGRPSDFVYLSVNPAFYRLTGLPDALGKRVTELIPAIKETNPELLDIYGAVATTGEPAEFDVDFTPIGRWLHVSATRPREGEFVAFFYDVTERKEAERLSGESERRLRRSEAEARETVARLSRAQQLGRMGDWEWDVAAGRVQWSEELYRIYGVGPDFETTFETIVRMTHPEDSEGNLRDAQAIIADPDHAPGALNFRIVRPDGGVRHIFQTIAVDRDTDGRVTRVLGIMQDVTELREAEMAQVRSERRLRRFYDAGLVGVVFWTAEGAITDANDRFLEMLGYTRAELEASQVNWAAMTPPEWAARDEQGLRELRTTGRNATPFEKEYYRKDGTRLPILVTAAILDDEGQYGVALVLDISDRKRAENDLRRLNLELEEHVRRRTADLEAANAELESFSYSVSHDLRAPLRHISGFAQLLAEHVGEGDDETQHFVEVITRSAADMGILIDDLLQFSRVGRAEMHLEQVDMEQLVREVLQLLQGELGDRRVDVEMGAVPPAVGDRTLLRQVWANLIDNAFKYTRPRDPAVVEIGSSDGPGEIVYWVRDNGVGFDMQYADRLFRVFERLHRSEEFEGNGIGLANVQRIVGRHGGRCWVEADEGEGAMFFFSLPAGRREQ